jgi:hypothetical protein
MILHPTVLTKNLSTSGFLLNYRSTSDGIIHYTTNDTNYATINNNIVTLTNTGNITVQITQEETERFYAYSSTMTISIINQPLYIEPNFTIEDILINSNGSDFDHYVNYTCDTPGTITFQVYDPLNNYFTSSIMGNIIRIINGGKGILRLQHGSRINNLNYYTTISVFLLF